MNIKGDHPLIQADGALHGPTEQAALGMTQALLFYKPFCIMTKTFVCFHGGIYKGKPH
ncbi:hypothetical protein ACMX2I_09180 [Bacillus sp. SW14]|uniref:hypothetical protein n=1 Tax=Bacillus sp. SW14 TaxID=3391618 RepID=UPI0039E5DC28